MDNRTRNIEFSRWVFPRRNVLMEAIVVTWTLRNAHWLVLAAPRPDRSDLVLGGGFVRNRKAPHMYPTGVEGTNSRPCCPLHTRNSSGSGRGRPRLISSVCQSAIPLAVIRSIQLIIISLQTPPLRLLAKEQGSLVTWALTHLSFAIPCPPACQLHIPACRPACYCLDPIRTVVLKLPVPSPLLFPTTIASCRSPAMR